jgi:putative lipase involved disintegration of autophagic bodies
MKKIIFNLTFMSVIFVLFFLSVILSGCESSNEKDDKDTAKIKKEQKEEIKNLPDWFLNPPIADDIIYATGYAKKKSMQLALDSATDWARQEISRIIQTKVSTMTKQFLEEAGVDNNSQLTEFSSVVSKSIASNTLSGSKIKERYVKQIGDKIAAYVLVEVTIKDLNAAIDAMAKENAADYSRLKANKAFDDLKNELKDLNSSKDFENPKQPDYEE